MFLSGRSRSCCRRPRAVEAIMALALLLRRRSVLAFCSPRRTTIRHLLSSTGGRRRQHPHFYSGRNEFLAVAARTAATTTRIDTRWMSTATSQTEIIEELYGEDDDETSHILSRKVSTAPPTTPARKAKTTTTTATENDTCFQVTAPYEPTGDQPEAIEQLVRQLQEGDKFSVLRGITGTGKTLVMSHVIARHSKPTLVLCHNKTLAAQLARELRSFLGNNAVELFVSYYNHYVPESYNEVSGTYVAKKSSINQDIDFMRHRATRALLTRQDVVVVASVSCIYGLGLPKDYLDASVTLQAGDVVEDGPEEFLAQLESMLYTHEPSDDEFGRGKYQYNNSTTSGRCDILLWPPHESFPMKIELTKTDLDENDHQQTIWRISALQQGHAAGHSPITSKYLFPAKHHVMSEDRLETACLAIEAECDERVKELVAEGKLEESSRLQQRVSNDLLMLRETGFCSGGENYSRHFAQREQGQPPDTLMDYLSLNGREWLLMVDESHVTLPQLRAMYGGDQARKRRLVKHGYRLPSALDNRPLQEAEFWERIQQAVFVSATPSSQEMEWAERGAIDMVIRPTFVCDPVIEVRPAEGQLDNLVECVRSRAQRNERSLAVALTKRDSEDLADYLNEHGIPSTFIHSGLNTHERADALKALQNGEVSCLVGVNLLREGLDLPQVSLVAILNADSEGFLRSETALLQTIGRAARNTQGQAIFYANRITQSMQKVIDVTRDRREKQLSYNRLNDVQTKSTVGSSMLSIFDLLKDQIAEEQPLEVVGKKQSSSKNADGLVKKSSISPDVTVQVPDVMKEGVAVVNTEHVPSTPGVYFWKDVDGNILYIGKAKKLRSRIKSYLAPHSNHSARIKIMMKKARTIDFILTKTDRDALLLESNLIKHHQPPYNVLLKDDESYPYICASVGDQYPRFFATPRRQAGHASNKYRYFGPYPHFKEIHAVLEGIESKYDLRAKSFMARHGSSELTREDYLSEFENALSEICSPSSGDTDLTRMRSEFEESALLFDSKHNTCRDVVTIVEIPGQQSKLVHLVQLRNGLIANRFSYTCEIPAGLSTEDDYAAAISHVLERRHYPSGEEATNFPFFPDEILLSHCSSSGATELKRIIGALRKEKEPNSRGSLVLRKVSSNGKRKESDVRAMELAMENAKHAAYAKSLEDVQGSVRSSVDGTALKELQKLLNLESVPKRIECYDISHMQGNFPVGSRVVFENGKPQRSLYRKFNIRSVEGVDDYASLKETLTRRFKRAWVNGEGGPVAEEDPWSIPDIILIDGGPGQLSAAVEALVSQRIYPFDGKKDLTGNSSSFSGQNRSATVVVCSLAKNREELFVFGSKTPINHSADSPALLLLRSLRDESHRFALTAHRSRRSLRNGT